MNRIKNLMLLILAVFPCLTFAATSDVELEIEWTNLSGQVERDAFPRGPLRDKFNDACVDGLYVNLIETLASNQSLISADFKYFVQVREVGIQDNQICPGRDIYLQVISVDRSSKEQALTGLYGLKVTRQTSREEIAGVNVKASHISRTLNQAYVSVAKKSNNVGSSQILKNIPKDFIEIIQRPKSWEERQWWIASEIIAITGLMMVLDEPAKKFFAENYERFDKLTWNTIEKFGNGGVLYPLLAITYAAGKVFNIDHISRTSALSLSSALVSGAIVNVIKFFVGRHRPYSNPDSLDFDGPVFKINNMHHSFPSGHTSNAFAVATIIALTYKDQPLVGVMAYAATTMVGVQRILTDKHWASDVFLGAIIGHLVAKFIYEKYEGIKSKKNKSWMILPAYLKDGSHSAIGLEFNHKWR